MYLVRSLIQTIPTPDILSKCFLPLYLQALCHIRELPSTGSHDDPLSYYQIGDFIKGWCLSWLCFKHPAECTQPGFRL